MRGWDGRPSARVGTSTDDVRRRNLSSVLTLVHHHRALSRAELTRYTGLSRSTMKDLVEELAERRSGRGVAAAAACPGRPAQPDRAAAATDMLAVAVNPEINAVTVGVVAMGGSGAGRGAMPDRRIPTAAETVAIAAEAVDRIRRGLRRRAARSRQSV